MIVPVADSDASPAVGDIGQMEAEHLTRPQAAIEHQTHHGKITPGAQLQQQPRDLLGIMKWPLSMPWPRTSSAWWRHTSRRSQPLSWVTIGSHNIGKPHMDGRFDGHAKPESSPREG